MPELPEVENVRRRLSPTVTGARITTVSTAAHRNYGPLPELAGSRVTALNRRGKWLVFELDCGRDMLVHLGMTGVLLVDPAPETVTKHVKLRLGLDSGSELVLRDPRGFGRARVVGHGDFASVASLAGLGPEPLPGVDLSGAALHLQTGRSPVKARLLSGRVVAGVGNYLADEVLWRARVHPATTRLSAAKAKKVLAELVGLVQESIAAGGSTLRDYRLPDGSSGNSQLLLRCYGRAGLPCDRCSTTLRHTVLAGRGTTLCPRCQRVER
jgi:formamidopyrimidine-DNA glycosylase